MCNQTFDKIKLIMSSLKQAVKHLEEGISCEKENDALKAIEHISSALRHFTNFSLNEDKVLPDLKNEIQVHVNHSVKRLEKLLQSLERDSEVVVTSENDAKFLVKKSLKFDDLCGMEQVKIDLTQALIMPIERPKLYSRGMKAYKGFLLYGVR